MSSNIIGPKNSPGVPLANEKEDIKEVEQSSSDSSPMTLLAVSFKEAALDSPSFRASMNHLSEQFDAVDKWLDSFIKASNKIVQEMDVLQDLVNQVITKFVPDFVTQGLIDHDYSMLVMRRYAEAMKYFWTNIIIKVKTQTTRSVEILIEFQRTGMRSFKDSRRNFENTQARFDNILARYTGVSKTKEPSALREDAFQVSEARRSYTKACFDLCCIIATFQRELDSALIDSLTHPWLLRSKSFGVDDLAMHRLGVDMHRIKSWSKAVSSSLKPIESEMLKARKEMEEAALSRAIPSRDLNDYTPSMSTLSHFVVDDANRGNDEKHGWLFVKTAAKPARQVWVRRWGFVKNGMFGWLNLSPSGTFVQEGDKIGVLLCNVSTEPNEERRFCFEVKTKDSTLILQAETLADLKSWLSVFEVAKRRVIQNDPHADMSFAFQKIPPLIPEFAASSQLIVDAEPSHRRTSSDNPQPTTTELQLRKGAGLLTSPEATKLLSIMSSGKSVLSEPTSDSSSENYFSTVGPYGTALAPPLILNSPMPTSMTKEAVILSTFLTQTIVPTAFTANFWGSVNWSLYLESSQVAPESRRETSVVPSNSFSSPVSQFDGQYPDYYPLDLRSQDAQMRAIFQTLVDKDPMDKVVMVFRSLLSPNPKQELPGRAFVTPRNIYLFSHTFGFTAMVKKSIIEFVSVEGHSSTSWDTLYLLTEAGGSSLCRIFLDSGRSIQKRLQYLIDLRANGDNPSLDVIIDNLKRLGADTRKPEGGESADVATDDSDAEDLQDSNRQLLRKYLGHKKNKMSTQVDRHNPTVLQFDLAKNMQHKTLEMEFDISPKALFHVMFGEESPVFYYTEGNVYSRGDLKITPWHNMNRRLEREITYDIVSKGMFLGPDTIKIGHVCNMQRVEKMEDNVIYLVVERRAPLDFNKGDSLFLVSRYLIVSNGKNKSRLCIFINIEWIRSSYIVRHIAEKVLCTRGTEEGQIIADRILKCRAKLGGRGMAVTAIRVFGRLGRGSEEDKGQGDAESGAFAAGHEVIKFCKPSDRRESPLPISQLHIVEAFMRLAIGTVVGTVSSLLTILISFGQRIWSGVSAHRVLVVGLLLSAIVNLFLIGKTSVSFWSERNAAKISKDLHIIPSSDTIMKRSVYLNDINDIINDGSALTENNNGLCYQKFRSIVYLPSLDDNNLDIMDISQADVVGLETFDKKSLGLFERVHRLRNEIGIRRHTMLLNLRMLNRIEMELVESEWQNWLLQEAHVCALLPQSGNETTLLKSSERDSLDAYCQSCLKDYASRVGSYELL